MKTLTMLALLAISSILPCTAQQQETREKRRPGPFLIWGPVHVIRDQRAAIMNVNGESIEGVHAAVLTIVYSEDGTRQEQTFYLPDGSKRRKDFLYDQDGKVLETTDFNAKGDVQFKSVNKYDGQRRLVEQLTLKADGSVFRRNTFVYQVNPPVTESIAYDQNGVVISKSTTTRSGKKSESESYMFGPDRTVRSESLYAPRPGGGFLSERRVDGNVFSREEFIPGAKDGGERIIYNPDGTIKSKERFTREFDSHHNLIKTIRLVAEGDSQDFKPADVTYRTIEYYE
jgi:antitoxin component YwqK of YwqJK toxin-antitoxin module